MPLFAFLVNVMQIEDELAGFSPQKEMLLTIGVFDGVHLGHKYLISQLKKQAAARGLLTGVVTFRRHPVELLSPDTHLPYLTSLDEKVHLLRQEGVDAVVPLSFTGELAGLRAAEFTGLLQKHLKMAGLVVGPDFALGKGREGDVEALKKLGQQKGFDVTVIEKAASGKQVISSTAVRAALADGDATKVIDLLGRPFSLEGKVISGDRRGRELGFPTANLEIDREQTLPADGIYATMSYVGGQGYKSVTNIGVRPTFDDKRRTVETYILDFSGDIYGRDLKIDIIARLRGEKKFDSIEDLKTQMTEDVRQSRTVLDGRGEEVI